MSLLTGNTIAYNLCGVGGKDCAIGAGTPSNSRLLLLRREALELALYTFKYIRGTQNVLTILPPGHPDADEQALKAPADHRPPPPSRSTSRSCSCARWSSRCSSTR